MGMHDKWEKALKDTEIVRPRVQPLKTFTATKLAYIFLAESAIHSGDTVVRKGEIVVQKPSLILPSNLPQFEGFDLEEGLKIDKDMLTNFLLIRGAHFPSFRYDNKTFSLDVFEGPLNQAVDKHLDILQKKEDVHTGLITGPADVWQFSVMIFICGQIAQSAGVDVQRILDEYAKKHGKKE